MFPTFFVDVVKFKEHIVQTMQWFFVLKRTGILYVGGKSVGVINI